MSGALPDPDARLSESAARKALLSATLLGGVIRFWFVLGPHPLAGYVFSDMEQIFTHAKALLDPAHVWSPWELLKPRGIGAVTYLALRAFPGEPDGWALALLGLVQALLSTLTIPLVFFGVRRFFGRRAAVVAAFIWALNYLTVSFVGYLLTETYVTFFLALAFALFDPERPWRGLASGVALGFGCLFKAQAAVLFPLWGVVLWWSGRRRPSRMRATAVALVVGALAVVGPETVAVSRIVGRFAFLAAYGGLNVYLGHCPVRQVIFDSGEWVYSTGVPKSYERHPDWPEVTLSTSIFDEHKLTQLGLDCLWNSPGHGLLWEVQQVADLFAGWPGSTIDLWPDFMDPELLPWIRIANLLMVYLLGPLAFATLWRDRRRLPMWLAFGLPMAGELATAVLFFGDPRYREPFDFFLVGAASASLIAWADRRRERAASPGTAPA